MLVPNYLSSWSLTVRGELTLCSKECAMYVYASHLRICQLAMSSDRCTTLCAHEPHMRVACATNEVRAARSVLVYLRTSSYEYELN